ncbi:MAG: glycosyltransferase [Methylococcales bacterium]|jgi:glycosyltransferase involved in cell wall biosynthesis|nr:glycosyltransferase [Methylococcales bacterium]
MKILLINKFHFLRGGAERVYLETKEILESNGHEVVCFSMKDNRNLPSNQEKYFVENVDFSNTKNWFKKSLRFLYYPKAGELLEQLIVKEKPDVAHIHNYNHQLTFSILKPLKKHKIPIVQTLHDYQLISPNYSLYSHNKIDECAYKRKYYKCVYKKSVRGKFLPSLLAALEMYLQLIFKFHKKIDLFVSPSKFLREKVRDWGFDVPIRVVPNFVDLEKLKPTHEPGDYVLFLGRLSQEKGVMTLVKAARKLPEIKVKIVGSGPQEGKIAHYIKKKQVKNVELLGRKEGDEVFELIKGCRFMVVPSEWYENYPMSVLESLALGKPVLASKLGGLQEMIMENRTGWFFEAGNVYDLRKKIKMHFPDLRTIEQLGKSGRKFVEQNNSSQMYYDRLMKCYYQVLPEEKQLSLG